MIRNILVAVLAVLVSVPSAMATVNPTTVPQFLVANDDFDIKGNLLNSAQNPFKAVLVTADNAEYELPSVVKANNKKAWILLPDISATGLSLLKVTLKISGGNVTEESAETFVSFLLAPSNSFNPKVSKKLDGLVAVSLPNGTSAGINVDGENGPDGAQGPNGESGENGPIGAVGPVGPVGAVGPQGPQGIIGLQGPNGNVGKTGRKGKKGAIGNVGIMGLMGPSGAPGTPGLQGPKGPIGDKGEDAEYHFSIFGSRIYDPGNVWNTSTHTVFRDGWVKLPTELYVIEGNTADGWVSFTFDGMRACYQGAQTSQSNDKKFVLAKLADISASITHPNQNHIPEIRCGNLPTSMVLNSESVIRGQDRYVKVNKDEKVGLIINGGVCGEDCEYTSALIHQVIVEPELPFQQVMMEAKRPPLLP